MTSLATPETDYSIPSLGLLRKAAAVVALAALADWLFFKQELGISIPLFLLGVALAASTANPVRALSPEAAVAFVVLALGLAPLVVSTNPLAVLFGVMTTAYASLAMSSPDRAHWRVRIEKSFWLIADGSWQIFADIHHAVDQWLKGSGSLRVAQLLKWAIPLLLSGVFLLLFTIANPLIEQWLTHTNPNSFLKNLDILRVLFWCITAALTWPFIFMRRFSRLREHLGKEFGLFPQATAPVAEPAAILNPSTIFRCLICFNLVFAVQTALDIAYLWGGMALPDGMTYATYAHRGAYPLILTALLAAAFVLVTLRPNSDTERWPVIRILVFAWTAQNILLVVSSILRLDLYVQVYSLTYLRIAAFVWMGLVATGLVLIVARIAFGKTNGWLVQMNLAAVAVVLYACCFVNFPRLIADFNVTQEIAGNAGTALDTQYLFSLGPQVLPGLDRYLDRRTYVAVVARQRADLVRAHRLQEGNWRAWTYENRELSRYLDNRGAAAER